MNFNQIRIYCSYHMFSRSSQDKGESGPLMLYAPFCSTSHIFMCGKLYEHELQGNTEYENTIRIGRGIDDWIEKRKVLCPKTGKGDFDHVGLTGDGYKISSSYLDLPSFQSSLYFPTFVIP